MIATDCGRCEDLRAILDEAEQAGVADLIDARRELLEHHQAREHANE